MAKSRRREWWVEITIKRGGGDVWSFTQSAVEPWTAIQTCLRYGWREDNGKRLQLSTLVSAGHEFTVRCVPMRTDADRADD
jgi:hypothetical protein